MASMIPTFLAAIRAVGAASTMTCAGFYLHRRNFVTPSGKKMMALLSQQVTIPAFLFAKIIYCPRNSGDSSVHDVDISDDGHEIICPSVADRISDLWMLLIWPFYVVSCGLLVGYIAARVSKTPASQINSCLAACAFGNSSGLPITLLTVIHHQFKSSSPLGRIDPTAFLSVYLVLYPVLQWGVGGWLLAPEEKAENDDKEQEFVKMEHGNGSIAERNPLLSDMPQNQDTHFRHACTSIHVNHLLNKEPRPSAAMAAGQEEFGGVRSLHFTFDRPDGKHQREVTSVDSSSALAMMVRELSFTNGQDMASLAQKQRSGSSHLLPGLNGVDDAPPTMDSPGSAGDIIVRPNTPTIHEHTEFTDGQSSPTSVMEERMKYDTMKPALPSSQQIQSMQEADVLPLSETLLRISSKVFQPPVIASLASLFIASFPFLRGLLQNIWGNDSRYPPLKWMFDGIYSVGQAAVPINMTILGINLSSTFQKKKAKKFDNDGGESKSLSNQTMAAIVIGKMIVMPALGIVSTWFLQRYYVNIPDDIDATCYLVMMIVFITPTANNVMVMVELSGSSSKEGMARIIGWQYLASPFILSVVLAAVVSLANCHFSPYGCSM
ncbi:hypothetical protein ACHAWF_008660 [Thalassiosira exigua]